MVIYKPICCFKMASLVLLKKNKEDNPKIKNTTPTNWATEVLPLTDIWMTVRDNRAWVNNNSIVVSIYNESLGSQLVWEFSWWTLPLQATIWIADTPDYIATIMSWQYYNWNFFRIPTPTSWSWTYEIKVVAHAVDNEWNIGNPFFNFNTRHACSYYPWCVEPLELSWIYINWLVWSTIYPWIELNITWSTQIDIDTTWQTVNCW